MVGSKNEPGVRRPTANKGEGNEHQDANVDQPTPLLSLDRVIALWDELDAAEETTPALAMPASKKSRSIQVMSIAEMCETAKAVKRAESSDGDAETSDWDRWVCNCQRLNKYICVYSISIPNLHQPVVRQKRNRVLL